MDAKPRMEKTQRRSRGTGASCGGAGQGEETAVWVTGTSLSRNRRGQASPLLPVEATGSKLIAGCGVRREPPHSQKPREAAPHP